MVGQGAERFCELMKGCGVAQNPRVPEVAESAAPVAPRSRGRRWLQNLALATGTFALCAALLEAGLRLAGYGNLEIYTPDARLYWRLKPNQDCFTKVDHKAVHINAHGTRGPEFSVQKPPGTFRILSLGDSRTFGWGLAEEETYSRQVEKLVAELLRKSGSLSASDGEREPQGRAGSPLPAGGANGAPGVTRPGVTQVEVINAGVNAWSYSQMAVYLREFGLRYQPDLVVLGEANLWTQFSENSNPEFVRKFLGRVRLKNLLRRFAIYHFVVEVQLQEFYQRNRTKFIPVDPKQDALFQEQQQSDPDAVFRKAIADVCRTARSNHIQPVLLFLPTLDDLSSTNLSPVLRAKRTVSAESGVPLVDLTPELRPEGKALYLDADPVHFNAHGNEIVARKLFDTVAHFLAP